MKVRMVLEPSIRFGVLLHLPQKLYKFSNVNRCTRKNTIMVNTGIHFFSLFFFSKFRVTFSHIENAEDNQFVPLKNIPL